MKTLLICILMLLSGCGVTSAEWDEAEKLCAHHGGLDTYYVFPSEDIWCANGITTEKRSSYKATSK